jgi:hypothetical protein
MSEPNETSGHPLALTITKQELQQGNATINSSSPSDTKPFKPLQLSNDRSEASAPTSPRRRPGTTTKTPSGPHHGSSRPRQQSAIRPNKMMSQAQSIHYTRTGRISKAKKGLKVHNCECGRVRYMHPRCCELPMSAQLCFPYRSYAAMTCQTKSADVHQSYTRAEHLRSVRPPYCRLHISY